MPTLAAVLTSLAVLGESPPPAPDTVQLKGEDGQSVILTAGDIAAAPRAAVRLTHGGKTTVFEGARLDGLLGRVAAPLGSALHGGALADVVLATGADGYRVVLALAEIDQGMRSEPVIVADREDGASLTTDGPFRLVVGGDLRPAMLGQISGGDRRAAYSVIQR